LTLATLTAFLSFLIPFGPHMKWPAIAALSALLFLGKRSTSEPVKRFKLEKFFIFVVFITVVLRILQAYILARHGDAYFVYIAAPRMIFDDGNYERFAQYSIFFYSGLWEYLTLIGNALLGGRPGEGLDAAQRFAQWCSA